MTREFLSENFGGRRAALSYISARVAWTMGRYAPFETIEWGRVRRLVFVCHGNICRSAFASAYARQLQVASTGFGLHARDDAPANAVALQTAAAIGIDLRQHRARNLAHYVEAVDDLVIAFEPKHAAALRKRCAVSQVTLAGLWSPAKAPYIHDPYGLPPAYFGRCFERVRAAVDGARARLRAA
jgi:protein-tyrosine phosphatase